MLPIRTLSLYVIIGYAKQKPESSFLRPHAPFFQNLVKLLVDMMSLLSENESWNKGGNLEQDYYEEDKEELARIAFESLESLSLTVRGNIATILFENSVMQAMKSSENWKERHAALSSILATKKNWLDSLQDNLDNVVNISLHFCNDRKVRVRWCAILLIGTLLESAPMLPERFHHRFLPVILTEMKDDANPTIQSVSAEATSGFCHGAAPDLIRPYLEDLMNNIIHHLRTKHEDLISKALLATADIAKRTKSEFIPVCSYCNC